MKRRPPIALDALDHILLMALRYALPRTISTGEPDREVIAAWTSQLPWLPSWALSQALEECAHVDRGDAACAGALCDSPTMRAAASERRGRFRAAVAGELAARAKEHTAATAKPSKKSAPGSKKKPHRMTAVPEADALAVQGALVAVALQPDGHWRLWATNPEKPGGALLTSLEWKKRWGGARRADLRVRLYDRARRCTHDSLDGDIGEEEL